MTDGPPGGGAAVARAADWPAPRGRRFTEADPDRRFALLGTYFPYEDGEVFLRAVDYIADSWLAPQDVTMIRDTNAADLLGLTGP